MYTHDVMHNFNWSYITDEYSYKKLMKINVFWKNQCLYYYFRIAAMRTLMRRC